MNRTAIYARVSTTDQDYAMQVEELRRIASQSKWEVVGEYAEKVSGAKGRGDRPELDRLLKDLHTRKVDNVMVWKLDRLGRSVADLLNTIEVIRTSGANLYSREDGIDTNTSMGKLMFTVVSAFAEFQRDIINENVRAGQARAMAKGVRFGRPPLKDRKRKRIETALREGKSVRVTAKELNIPVGTVAKVRREMSIEDKSLAGEAISLGTFRVTRTYETLDSTTLEKIADGVDPEALKTALKSSTKRLKTATKRKAKSA